MPRFWLIGLMLLAWIQNGCSMQLKNITTKIFGETTDLLPVAFGDFNSDKMTDVIMVNKDRNKIFILLASEQTFSSALTSHTYFTLPSQLDKKNMKLECTLEDDVIESIVPGDFDGDGGRFLSLKMAKIQLFF